MGSRRARIALRESRNATTEGALLQLLSVSVGYGTEPRFSGIPIPRSSQTQVLCVTPTRQLLRILRVSELLYPNCSRLMKTLFISANIFSLSLTFFLSALRNASKGQHLKSCQGLCWGVHFGLHQQRPNPAMYPRRLFYFFDLQRRGVCQKEGRFCAIHMLAPVC